MNLSYRTRQRLRRIFTVLLTLAVIAVVLWLVWIIWLGRFVVYTQEGAKLDFSLSHTFPSGQIASAPPPGETIHIIYNDLPPEETIPTPEEASPVQGYYIDLADVTADPTAVQEKLESLPKGTAVLLDVKDGKGHFYFSTSLGDSAEGVDIAAMDQIIGWLLDSDLHVIARLPAFRDWAYCLNNVEDGLPKVGAGGALWWDDEYCYWLDPTADGTLEHLIAITLELRLMGFDEVVYTEFRFPYTDQIIFEGDQAQAIADAAAKLATVCANDRFCLSFTGTDATFPLPQGNCRLYLQDIPAAEVYDIAQQVQTDDPSLHLMFLTTVNDTRFDDYCVLRPLANAR